MRQPDRFWDRIAGRYARRRISDEAAYEKKLAITREYLRPDMEVLEFGCGTGSTALVHAPLVRHIRALDCSSKMLEIARARAEAAGVGNVSFEKATIEELDVPESSVEVVLGLSILHLLDDRRSVVAKVHRMLRPGGVFVSNTACLDDSLGWLKYVLPVARWVGLAPYVAFFTTRELVQELTTAGFAIEHQWTPGKSQAVFIVARKPV